uniref:MYND-type domain-containing protein n=1 Tax=Glossina austeni TaxID=7395 RepID=A0A1A9VYD5_GLOAU
MPREYKRSKSRQSGQSSHDSDFHSYSEKQEYLRQNGDTQSNENRQHRCGLCLKPATQACERCGDYYCSRECQRRDWPDHRPICFRMPRLVPIGSGLEDDNNTSCNEMPKMASGAFNNSCDAHDAHDAQPENSAGIPMVKANSIRAMKSEDEKTLNGSRSQLSSDQILPPKFPKHGSCVILITFRTPNRCYVRSSNPSDAEAHTLLLKKVEQYGKTAPQLKNAKINGYAITMRGRTFHRVQIVSRNENRYRVHFIDHGHMEHRILKELLEINDEILNLPRYASCVQLHNVKRSVGLDNFAKKFSPYDNKEFKILYVRGNIEIPLVNLHHWQSNKSLNEEIAKLISDSTKPKELNESSESNGGKEKDSRQEENAQIAENSNHIKRPYNAMNVKDDMAINPLPADNEVHSIPEQIVEIGEGARGDVEAVAKESNHNDRGDNKEGAVPKRAMPTIVSKQIEGRCMNPPFKVNKLSMEAKDFNLVVLDNGTINFGYVGCIPQAGLAALRELQTYLVKEYKDDGRSYDPQLNEYCLAYYDREWYRAKVIEKPVEDEYTVYYIDFTNELTVRGKDIRRYPKDLTIDCNTNLCLIDGLPSVMEDKEIDFLKTELTFYSVLKADYVKEVDEDLVIIRCDNLLTKMKENGLL